MSRTNFVSVLVTLLTFSTIAQSEPLAEVKQAQELEAKKYMVAINRRQMAYFAEHFLETSNFSSKISDLNPGSNFNIPVETASYSYKTRAYYSNQSWLLSRKKSFVISTATPKHPGLKSYTSGVLSGYTATEPRVFEIVCESLQPSKSPPVPPTLVKVRATQNRQPAPTMSVEDRPQCASGSREVK